MTLNGVNSIHELSDLLGAYTWQLAAVDAAQQTAIAEGWLTGAHKPEAEAWETAYGEFLLGYAPVKARAQALVEGVSDFVWDYEPATDSQGDVFPDLATAFHPMVELFGELGLPAVGFPADALAELKSRMRQTPQPTAKDLDLSGYQIADSAIQRLEQAEKQIAQKVPWYLGPLGLVVVGVGVVVGVKVLR